MTRVFAERELVSAASPVHGLPRRRLSFIPVLTQSVAAVAPSGAAAVIPALLLTTVGGGSTLLAFAAAMVVITLVSACLRPLAQRMAAVGGIYSYAARGLGPFAAIPTGWSAIIGYASVAMAGLLAVGTSLAHILVAAGLSEQTSTIGVIVVALLAAAAAAVLLARGILVSSWTTLLIECISIALLGVVLTVLLVSSWRGPEVVAEAMRWRGDLSELAPSVVVAVSAFVGFESSTTLSREARAPFRSVPRAILYTPLIAGFLYLLAVPIQAIALSDAPDSVLHSLSPLVELLAVEGLRELSVVLDLGIATSFFACTLASVNALVRVLFTMGREGVAPSLFGRTHPRLQTPVWAIVVAVAVIVSGPVIAVLAGAAPDQAMRGFLTLSACGYIGSYLAGALASPALQLRIGESTRRSWLLGLSTATLLLLLAVGAATAGGGIVLLYAALMALALLYTAMLRWISPHRLRGIGIHDETQRGDLLRWGAGR